MQYYIIILSVYVSLILPINSCTLYINVVIQCEEKMHTLSNDCQLYNSGQWNIPFFVIMPGYMTHSKLLCDMTP